MIGVSVAKIDNDEGNNNVYDDNSNDKEVNNGINNVQNFSKKWQMNDFLGSGPEGVYDRAISSKFRPSVHPSVFLSPVLGSPWLSPPRA